MLFILSLLLKPPTLGVARFTLSLEALFPPRRSLFHPFSSLPAVRVLLHSLHPSPTSADLSLHHIFMLPSLLTMCPESPKHLPFVSMPGAKHGVSKCWIGPVCPPDSCMTKLLVNCALSTTFSLYCSILVGLEEIFSDHL